MTHLTKSTNISSRCYYLNPLLKTVLILVILSPSNVYSQCNVEGGELTTNSATTLCIDGIPDLVGATSTGAFGTNLGWIITDENENILDCPSSPPFEFDGAGEGRSSLYRIAFEDDITGKVPGLPIADLGGCFDLSNPIVITRDIADGGAVNSNLGMDVQACSGDIMLEMLVLNAAINLNYRFALTDENNIIIATTGDSTINLSNAPIGECHVWGWSFGVEPLPDAGDHISVLADGACESLSVNFVRVIKLDCSPCPARGGTITPTTETVFCINSAPDFFGAEIIGAGDSSLIWVVTDVDSTILALQEGLPLKLEGLIDDDVVVWHMEYESDLSGLAIGNRLSDLRGCFGLSNSILVARQRPDGGVISSNQGSTVIGCSGSMIVEVATTSTASMLQYMYVLVDSLDFIAASSFSDSILIDSVEAGSYKLYGWSFDSQSLPNKGDSLSSLQKRDCQILSDNFLLLSILDCGDTCDVRTGEIFTFDNTTVCIDANSDFIVADTKGGKGAHSEWIITNENDIILGTFAEPVFTLNSLGVGVSGIWNIRYEDGLTGLNSTNSLFDIRGCFSLSNVITINRVTPNGGFVTSDRGNEVIVCQGNVELEMLAIEYTELLDYTFIVTDLTDTIIGFTDSSSLLLDSVVQDCRIYGWSHLNEPDPMIGTSIFNLEGTSCTSLSHDFVLLTKKECGGNCVVSTSTISTPNSTVLCEVDNLEVFISDTAIQNESAWVMTNLEGEIISIQEDSPLNLDSLGLGLIWHLQYFDGLFGLDTANFFSDLIGCYSISNFITIERDIPDGGTIESAQGDDIVDCPGFSVVNLSTSSTSNFDYSYIVTDTLNQVLDFTQSDEVILRDENHYRIWGWSISNPYKPPLGTSIEDLGEGDCQEISINFISALIQDDGFCVTSSNNLILPYQFEISPNPSTDNIVVVHRSPIKGAGLIEIYSPIGQLVSIHKFTSQDGISNLNLGHLATGSYLMRIKADKFIGAKLFVIL